MMKLLRELVRAFHRHMAHLNTGIAMLEEIDKSYPGRGFWRR
jgi:hypothetical protein